MTSSLVSSAIANTTDAEFRTWSKQISDQLAAVGLVKTTDTGQIDFTTVTRPAASAYGGYEIYRFDDTLQATRPLFIKIEYGSGSTQTFPVLRLTVGTATNGAGTLSGIVFGPTVIGRQVALTTTPSNSYACKLNSIGFVGFSGWGGSAGTTPFGVMLFAIARTVDDAGTPTDEGVAVYFSNGTSLSHNVWSFVTSATIAGGTLTYTFIPSGITSSTYGTSIQTFRHYASVPRVRNLPGFLTYFNAELAKGSSFSVAPLAGVSRTYVALGDAVQGASSNNRTTDVLAMAFE